MVWIIPGSSVIQIVQLPVPPPKEQQEIKKRCDAISSKLETESLRPAKLQKQKSGLMHDLLTGKVPVTPDLEEAGGA
jgi:type I restriction enzyme, S subunit